MAHAAIVARAAAHPRLLADLRSFLQTLADNDAVCGLACNNGGFFRFRDTAQIAHSLDVLNRANAIA